MLIERRFYRDERGYFEKLSDGIQPIMQVNYSVTKKKGTVRGMHYQDGETKVVTCVQGKVFDVDVNLMDYSYEPVVLSEDGRHQNIIYPGHAHGFQALTDDAILIYLHTKPYDPLNEKGLHPLDEKIGIEWPLRVICLSERDKSFRRIP